MGRGRAKAKQQKVARELKYNTHFTDLDALQRELGASDADPGAAPDEADSHDDEYENWTARLGLVGEVLRSRSRQDRVVAEQPAQVALDRRSRTNRHLILSGLRLSYRSTIVVLPFLTAG